LEQAVEVGAQEAHHVLSALRPQSVLRSDDLGRVATPYAGFKSGAHGEGRVGGLKILVEQQERFHSVGDNVGPDDGGGKQSGHQPGGGLPGPRGAGRFWERAGDDFGSVASSNTRDLLRAAFSFTTAKGVPAVSSAWSEV
jgi:hypothetical protein